MSFYPDHLVPEEELLIFFCRLDFSESQKSESGRLMASITDWTGFLKLAIDHGITSLIWHNISVLGINSYIPADILKKLYDLYLRSLASDTMIRKQLGELGTLSYENKIPFVVLKGLALEEAVYGNLGLRQMEDLDILTRSGDALKMRRLLLKSGYTSAPMISPLFERKILPHGKHLPEMCKNGIQVEIHFKLFSQNGNGVTEDLFNDALDGQGSKNFYFPKPQLFFLYLVKHLDKHEKEGISQLKLYTDLFLLLQKYGDQILNKNLIKIAAEADIMNALAEKLYIMEVFWGMNFPEDIKELTGKTDMNKVTEKFIWFLRHPMDNEPKAEAGSLFRSLGEMNAPDKILFLTGYIFPSLTFLKYKYALESKLGAVLYYPVWWGRMIGMVRRRKGVAMSSEY
jgi:hypothetical protein